MAPLIDQVLPSWSLRQVDHLAVTAPSERAWATVRHLDLYRIGLARQLFSLRQLPERARARLSGRTSPWLPTARIEDFTRPGMGFQVLAEGEREVVVGAVGRFWQPEIQFAQVRPERFAAFAEPGFGKVAWSLEAAPRSRGGTWLTIDLRVAFTDATARRLFRPYWSLIGRFSHAIRRSGLRHFEHKLGAAPADGLLSLPGDELLPGAPFQVTHAVNVEAPPEALWPWLVQMGAARAGWYSWDRLDNGGVPSAERIVPGLQHIQVGDILPALPSRPGGFAVLQVERARALVLGSPSLLPGGVPRGLPTAPPFRSTWSFALEPIGTGATRLTVRSRAAFRPSLRMALTRAALATAHEVMERRQLHNLKRRAERTGVARA